MAIVRTRPQPPPKRPATGRSARAWSVTTITGIAVLALVTVHMVANHFVVESIGGLRDYHQVLEYISNPVIFVLESLFLVAVTIHALTGVRAVLLDLDPGPKTRAWIDRGLIALGAVTLAYGFTLIGVLASRA